MNPVYHPAEELWFDFVAGQIDPATRTLLDAHLGYCPACRAKASGLSAAGATQLAEAAQPLAAPSRLLEGILARLAPPAPPRVAGEALPLPQSLWPLFPDLGQASWHGALTRGFRYLQVPQEGPSLFLVHLQAGRPFPRHGHQGVERSLILAGGLRDGDVVLEAGDFEETAVSHVHAPVALADEDCWLLASLNGNLRFHGWRGLLQRMAG